MKVVSVANADGPLGQCTAKCYDAPDGSRCRCVCGGRNHGKGEHFALAGAREIAARFPGSKVTIDERADQLTLWTDPSELQKFCPPRNAAK